MIGIDWGTSSLRAWRLAADGTVLARQEAALGILAVPPGGFAATLDEVAADWLALGEARILLCGMVGSRQGWAEAPYLPCPAAATDLASALLPVPFDGAACAIVPGLSCRIAPTQGGSGVPEVMRGEETQILGVLDTMGDAPATLCLPGTHSKWARVAGGRILDFTTHMTGEAFAALSTHTILGRGMAAGAPGDEAAFDDGVRRARESGGLLHHLFGTRSRWLFGELADTATASYLSGLLIGHEVAAALERHAPPVHLVGGAALAARYARALALHGAASVAHDPEAAARGLSRIGKASR